MGSPENKPSLGKRILNSTAAGALMFFGGGGVATAALVDGVIIRRPDTIRISHQINDLNRKESGQKPDYRALADMFAIFAGIVTSMAGMSILLGKLDEFDEVRSFPGDEELSS